MTGLEERLAFLQQVGDHRPVARLAHLKLDRVPAADFDGLAANLEGQAPLRREVAGGVVGVDTLDEEVLHVGPGVGEAPGEVARLAQQREGQPRQRRAHDLELRRLDMGEVPDARHLQAQVRVVGEQRLAGFRVFAAQHPGVGAEPGRAGQRQGGRERIEVDAGGVEGQRTPMRPRRRIVGMLGPEVLQLRPVERAGEARAAHLVLEVVAQVPGHHLEPDQAVGGPPGLGLVAEQNELRRQQAGAGLQIGVHALGIGLEDRLRVGREHLEVPLGDTVDAERAQELVRLDGGLAHDLRKPRLADPALHLQLPEPVLRVDVAHGEGGVPRRARIDVRDRMRVADDLHGCIEARHLLGAIVGGKREPRAGAHSQQQRKQREGAERRAVRSQSPEAEPLPPASPAEGRGAHHASPSTIARRCWSSAGADGRSVGSG